MDNAVTSQTRVRARRALAALTWVFALAFAASCGIFDSDEEEPPPENPWKYALTVHVDEGLWGGPSTGTHYYQKPDTIDYIYGLNTSYSELAVTLDGVTVPDSGSFYLDRDMTLNADCVSRAIWRLTLPKQVYYCCPAVASDGTIYVTTGMFRYSESGSVHAVSPGGAILWTYDLDYNAYSPVVGTDGSIYVQDAHNQAYALTPAGALKWKFNRFDTPIHPWYDVGQRMPAVAEDGTVYVPADGLYALDPDTGERLWHFAPRPGSCRQSPVIAGDGTIYVFIHQHDFYAVNPDSTLKWHTQLDHDWEMSFACPAIAGDGTIYVGAEGGLNGWVYAFDPADGSKKWKYDVVGDYRHVRASPTIAADGTIYVTTKAGTASATALVIALNPDGTEKWTYELENLHNADDSYSTPSVGADGMIYCGAETSYFYAFRPDGTLAWKTMLEFGLNWSSAAITPDGTAYIGTHTEGGGNLYALRTSSLGYASSPWPRFRGGNQNTGRSGH